MKNLLTKIKYMVILLLVFVAGTYVSKVPTTTNVDFTTMRKNLDSLGIKPEVIQNESENASLTADPDSIAFDQKRSKEVDEIRARSYVEYATNDYHHGSYEEALRRLDRARIYDPSNYSIFKLSGQIFFEKNNIRKAFNNLERANQLPNDDTTISRNLDVLKRLIRYSRTEIDKLQRTLYAEPNDRVARARLKELEDQMRE